MRNKQKHSVWNRLLSSVLSLAVVLSSFVLASKQTSQLVKADNWDEAAQEAPNYWPVPEGYYVREAGVGDLKVAMPEFVGVSHEDPVVLEMNWNTFWGSGSPGDYKFFQLKPDVELLPYIKEIRGYNTRDENIVPFRQKTLGSDHIFEANIDQKTSEGTITQPGLLDLPGVVLNNQYSARIEMS